MGQGSHSASHSSPVPNKPFFNFIFIFVVDLKHLERKYNYGYGPLDHCAKW